MPISQKTIEIVAGPNGCGKTTFAESYLQSKNSIYLNPDLIALGISPTLSEKTSMQAGRVLIGEVRSLIGRGQSFCFESTLSGMNWLRTLRVAKHEGYRIIIYFIFLRNFKQNISRIKKRVQQGGHHIPTSTVKRRIPRSIQNFWNLYRPLCDSWYLFDNSDARPSLVCHKTGFDGLADDSKMKFAQKFLARGQV